MSKRKKYRASLFANILFSIICLISLTVTIVVLILNFTLKNEITKTKDENANLTEYKDTHPYTESDLTKAYEDAVSQDNQTEKESFRLGLRDMLNNGGNVYEIFRSIFPEDLIVASDGRYVFYPISDQYKHHSYIKENFVKNEETGEVTYIDNDGNVLSKKGIDVSKHNGDIDWEKVKADGVTFAIIRVGYRGSSEGKLVLDETFVKNIKGAIKNDIEVGVYFFTQAVNPEEAKEEAQFVLDAIEPYDITYPVIWDIEELDGRAEDVEADIMTDSCIAFLDMVEHAGYKPMIYGNLKSMLMMLETDRIEPYDKWFAYYSFPEYYPYEFGIWQYTADGKVDGIKGAVDLNIDLVNYANVK